jgi:Smg protein
MIEILMYLFENYMGANVCMQQSTDKIILELQQVGFPAPEIECAFDWLADLSDLDESVYFESSYPDLIRYFSREEEQYIDLECQRFLLYLQQANIITPPVREIIIDRALALGMEDVTLGKLKWVALMVLFSRPSEQHALIWIQDFILNSGSERLH